MGTPVCKMSPPFHDLLVLPPRGEHTTTTTPTPTPPTTPTKHVVNSTFFSKGKSFLLLFHHSFHPMSETATHIAVQLGIATVALKQCARLWLRGHHHSMTSWSVSVGTHWLRCQSKMVPLEPQSETTIVASGDPPVSPLWPQKGGGIHKGWNHP